MIWVFQISVSIFLLFLCHRHFESKASKIRSVKLWLNYICTHSYYSVNVTEGAKWTVELTTPYFSHACHCEVCYRRCFQCATHRIPWKLARRSPSSITRVKFIGSLNELCCGVAGIGGGGTKRNVFENCSVSWVSPLLSSDVIRP